MCHHLTLYEERSFLKQALAAGVKGYVLKRSAAENLVSAIRAVQFGETYVDPLLGDEVREGGRPWPIRCRKSRPILD